MTNKEVIAFIESSLAKFMIGIEKEIAESYYRVGLADHKYQHKNGAISFKNQLLKSLKAGEEHE